MQVDILKLLISVAASTLINFLGTIIYSNAENKEYLLLKRPPILAQEKILSQIKAVVTFIMSISFYFLWITEPSKTRDYAMSLYGILVLFSISGPYFQFILRRFSISVITMTFSIIVGTVLTIMLFGISKIAALLMVPFVFWMSYLLLVVNWMTVMNKKK